MDGHVVHPLLSLLFNHFEHDFGVEIFDALHPRNRLVDRYRANRNRRMPENSFANLVNVTTGRKIHHGIRTIMNRGVQLVQFIGNIRGDCAVADIRIDLA